jgi:hypothetical protein
MSCAQKRTRLLSPPVGRAFNPMHPDEGEVLTLYAAPWLGALYVLPSTKTSLT